MRMKNHFHINGFALSPALKQRLMEQLGSGLAPCCLFVYFSYISAGNALQMFILNIGTCSSERLCIYVRD